MSAGGPTAGALTPREHEVVALLGAGLSNRDIAKKLFISPATAARHVANILAKLGFSSRSQVAAWANGGYGDSRSARTDWPGTDWPRHRLARHHSTSAEQGAD